LQGKGIEGGQLMELDAEVFCRFGRINWLSRCGFEPPNDLPFRVQRASDIAAAIECALSSIWQDAGTEAQGDLSAYLAKHHAEADCYWNDLSRRARERIQNEIMPTIIEAIGRISAEALSDVILLDLNRIAIQSTYAKRFKRIPDFYQRLLVVYERGHLPCGWIGDLDLWPEGQLIVF
jgi:hypothetical protein